MSRQQRKMKRNKWEKRFFLLLGINVLILIVLASLIFWPVDETEIPSADEELENESSEFVVRTSKQNLNELINAYIMQLTSNTNQNFRVELDEDVHLIGELPVFSATVPLSVHFDPEVVENGDIILNLQSISVGMLELPNRRIMSYLGNMLPLPDWVIVNPDDEQIYVAITDMDIRSNFQLAVENLDLEGNNLAFRINVPYDTLGIDYLRVKNLMND